MAPDDPGADDLALIDLPTFQEQWAMVHGYAGAILENNIGAPVPLQDQAESAGGRKAGECAYRFFSTTPILRRMFLDPNSSTIGSIIVVGMHGMACINIVKAAKAQAGGDIAFQSVRRE
jgi:hypothetical protein